MNKLTASDKQKKLQQPAKNLETIIQMQFCINVTSSVCHPVIISRNKKSKEPKNNSEQTKPV